MANNSCKQGEISMSSLPKDAPVGIHVWTPEFFWTEQNCNARQCQRCLRLEWDKKGKFVEAPIV